KDVIRQFLVLLERIPSHVVIIFATTVEGQERLFEDYDDASPLLSRCLRFDLARRDLCKPFARRLVQIARDAGLLNGHPHESHLPRAERILKDEGNNLRAALQRVEAGELAV